MGFFKQFLKKAKEESSKQYSVGISSEDSRQGWIGMDLDGTLARSDMMISLATIGKPVPEMVKLLKQLIEKGNRVKIFTARASDPEQLPLIRKWLKENDLPELEITNAKDYNMIRCYDDRAIQVIENTGKIVENK